MTQTEKDDMNRLFDFKDWVNANYWKHVAPNGKLMHYSRKRNQYLTDEKKYTKIQVYKAYIKSDNP